MGGLLLIYEHDYSLALSHVSTLLEMRLGQKTSEPPWSLAVDWFDRGLIPQTRTYNSAINASHGLGSMMSLPWGFVFVVFCVCVRGMDEEMIWDDDVLLFGRQITPRKGFIRWSDCLKLFFFLGSIGGTSQILRCEKAFRGEETLQPLGHPRSSRVVHVLIQLAAHLASARLPGTTSPCFVFFGSDSWGIADLQRSRADCHKFVNLYWVAWLLLAGAALLTQMIN